MKDEGLIINNLFCKLAAHISEHAFKIVNSGGCGSAFSVFVVSPEFEGKKLLERQRLVMNKLQEEMKTIHALTFKKCITPQQYEEYKQQQQQ